MIFDTPSTPKSRVGLFVFRFFTCGITEKQSGGWVDVLGSDSNELLEHKFAATSQLLWQKRIFSMPIQLAFDFVKKHVLDGSQEPDDGKPRKLKKNQ